MIYCSHRRQLRQYSSSPVKSPLTNYSSLYLILWFGNHLWSLWLQLLGATIAHSQAQWHPDPPFPLVEIMISKVTSFSCAIVNILVSRIPAEVSAQPIFQRWLSPTSLSGAPLSMGSKWGDINREKLENKAWKMCFFFERIVTFESHSNGDLLSQPLAAA